MEKAGTVTDASVKRTKSKCSHCGKPGHKEEDCWKKHPHKAPPRCSTEASGTFLDEELLVCHIAQDEMPYVMQGIEEAYYCVPAIEDGQWNNLNNWMGLVNSIVLKKCYKIPAPAMLVAGKKKEDLSPAMQKCWKKRYQPAPPLGAVP